MYPPGYRETKAKGETKLNTDTEAENDAGGRGSKTPSNCATGASHADWLLVLQRDADRRPAKHTGKRVELEDAGRARTPWKDGENYAQQVKAPLKQREQLKMKCTSATQTQRRDVEWAGGNA